MRGHFATVALPHLDAVHRMARTLARNDAEADDLVQETFIRAYRAFASFELREQGAKPWLLKILHNTFFSHRARQRREPTLMENLDFESVAAELDDPSLSEGVRIDWDTVDEELKRAVAELPTEFQTVLLLWSIEGLSYREIAEVCGCALGTVMSRLYRARQLLIRRLAQYAQSNRLPIERLSR